MSAREEWITPDLPQLILPAPQCSHCGHDVQIEEESAWCEYCRVAWDRIFDGDVSEPDPDVEGSDVPCEIVDPPIAGLGLTLVHGMCVLPSGHEGDHLCPMRREFASDVEIRRRDA